MVYVVERYLPGLSRDLLRGLSNLQQLGNLTGEDSDVRYLDSTIVLPDEACYCRFEGPSEAAIADANRRAGLPFDRIVPAVTVNSEGRNTMSTTTTAVPATVQLRRSHLLGLIVAAVVLAAVVTWAVSTFAVGTSNTQSRSVTGKRSASLATTLAPTCVSASSRAAYAVVTCSSATGRALRAASRPAALADHQQTVIMSITPAALAAGALGGYALPSLRHGPAIESVLASMSPATRRYTKMIMSLTFGQLKAGAAGAP